VIGVFGHGSDRRVIEGDSDGDWVEPVYFEVSRVLKPNSLCCTFYGWPHAEIFRLFVRLPLNRDNRRTT
jgi:hypothetical protein